MNIRHNESSCPQGNIDEMSSLKTMTERDGCFVASTSENPAISVAFCPKSGIIRIEAETTDGDADRIDIDLVAEFWRITRRETEKELPKEHEVVLVGKETPQRTGFLNGTGDWVNGPMRYDPIGTYPHWWPLPKKEA